MLALADCAVVVSDAETSARWWVEKMGFLRYNVGGAKHAVMVAPPGERFILHLCSGFESAEPGNTGIAFMTDEIEAVVARMKLNHVRFVEPLKLESWGGVAKFADPDGNIFWLLGAPTAFVHGELSRRAGATEPSKRTPRKGRTTTRARRRATGSRPR